MALLSAGGAILRFPGGPLNLGVGGGGVTPQALAIVGFNIALPTNMSFGTIAGIQATGGLGGYTYSINQAGITDINYEMQNDGSIVFYSGAGPWTVGRVDTFHAIVSDATGATATVACTVTFQASGVITASNYLAFYNSQPLSGTFLGFGVTGPGFSGTDVTITDASGNFSGTDYLYPHGSSWPTPGAYPLVCTAPLTAGGVLTQNFTLHVVNDPGPALLQFTATSATTSSSSPIGTVVGQVLADGSPLVATYALASNAGGRYSINGQTGVISVASARTAGVDVVSVLVTRSGLTLSQMVPITVAAGTVLPASNMTMTVATNLTNFALNSATPRAVGTPTVAGITGTPVWTLDQNQRNPWDEDTRSGGHGHARYVINSATGAVTAVAQLSAQTDTLVLTCTDGINTCTQSFPVTVAATVGPTLYVGQGMVAAHGSSGFEHWADLTALFQSPNATYAGATVIVYPNSDPNYYANDNGGTLDPRRPNDQSLRFGLHGPLTIMGATGGARPRLGGTIGQIFGAVDSGDKGFIVLSDGDFTFSHLEISDVHANGYQGGSYPNSSGTGCAFRQNGVIWGNLSITDCYLHDCDQGIETGICASVVSVTYTEIANCGGTYVGSGATHNAYIGNCSHLIWDHNLSWKTINGHTLKVRALTSSITNSRFFDTERGGASCQIDICDGGSHVIDTCVLHKGSQPQNPYSIQFCEELQTPGLTKADLTVQNCTLICDTPTGFPVNAIFMSGRCLASNGVYSTATSTNNSFFGYLAGTTEVAAFNTNISYDGQGANIMQATGVSDGRACAVVSTGRTTLSTHPALDLTNPQTGSVSPRPSAMYVVYDGENRNNWVNYANFEIDIGVDDLRVAATTSVGTVLFTPTIRPSIYSTGAPSYANPFASGSVTWSIRQDAGPYVGGLYGVAPAGRYTINALTGAVSVGQALTQGNADKIILRAVASNGTVIQEGSYVVVT